jgi:hypothetical protein
MKKNKSTMNKLQSVRLKWYNTDKAIQKKYRTLVINSLRNMKGLNSPSQLVSHSIFVGDDYLGPSIFVYGKNGSNYFHCEYFAETEWSTLCATS